MEMLRAKDETGDYVIPKIIRMPTRQKWWRLQT